MTCPSLRNAITFVIHLSLIEEIAFARRLGKGRSDQKPAKVKADSAHLPETGYMMHQTNFAFERRMELHPIAMSQMRENGRQSKAKHAKDIWIWYEFPPLEGYTRDMYTPSKAILRNLDDAIDYLNVGELRDNLIETFQAATEAMAKEDVYKPYNVFDAAFYKRKPVGAYDHGPRDSFVARASATLFAAAAYMTYDYDVHEAAIALLKHFTGDCSYSDKGSGSSLDRKGYWTKSYGNKPQMVPLVGCDPYVLKRVNVDERACKEYTISDGKWKEMKQ